MAKFAKLVILLLALTAIKSEIEKFDMDFDLERDNLIVNETIQLQPNTPFEFANPLFFKVKVSCKVSTADASDTIEATMLKGSAKLNNQDVGAGIKIDVKNGDSFTIEASGSAKARLTNLGVSAVSADCSLGEESLEQVEYLRQVLNNAADKNNYTDEDEEENVFVEYYENFEQTPIEYRDFVYNQVGNNENPTDVIVEEEVVDNQYANDEEFLAILN
jgi:hypothetical protein